MAVKKLVSEFFQRVRPTTTTVRVAGLVKAMSLAREQLTNGIPQDHVDNFRLFINRTIENTEQICHTHHIKPQDLPSPSYHAYQYLKEIDLTNLPTIAEGSPSHAPIHISNLNAATRHIQLRMMEAAREIFMEVPGSRKHIRLVQNLVTQQVSLLHIMLKKKQASVYDLPARNMQSALWLIYLGNNENYLHTIQQLVNCCRIYENIRTKTRQRKNLPGLQQMLFEFTPMAALYRWRIKDGLGMMSIHPGFLSAEDETLEAIISSAMLRRVSKHSLQIRQMASNPAFLEITRQLEGEAKLDDGAGQIYNLNELFHEVNKHYFQGKCEQPKLKWSSRFTRRKFGMYLPSSDTVVVSLSLDQPSVPRYVTAFIVYHEILHKWLGMKDTAKRQIAHTSEFRRLEKQFERYEDAQHYLEKLARAQ
jgi:hypothetical protein